MGLRLARFINLLMVSVLVGNEFGSWAGMHPALSTLPSAAQMRAEQAVLRRYLRLMPVMMVGAIASCLPVLALIRDRRTPAFRCTLTGMACFVAMLGVTFVGNMPINRRILAHADDAPPADWSDLRARWDRWHTLRNALNFAGLGLLYAGVLWPTEPEERD